MEDCCNHARAEMVPIVVRADWRRALLRFQLDLCIESLSGTCRGVGGVVGDLAPMLPLVPSNLPKLPDEEAGPAFNRAF